MFFVLLVWDLSQKEVLSPHQQYGLWSRNELSLYQYGHCPRKEFCLHQYRHFQKWMGFFNVSSHLYGGFVQYLWTFSLFLWEHCLASPGIVTHLFWALSQFVWVLSHLYGGFVQYPQALSPICLGTLLLNYLGALSPFVWVCPILWFYTFPRG